MIRITITGKLTGRKALLYEELGRKGRRKFVPTYHALAECLPTKECFEFAVVRDTSPQVFGQLPYRYGKDGECPPSLRPYVGIVRDNGPVGFRIQLSEVGFEKTGLLLGQGRVARERIQIHFGAAASHGCILVAGRRRTYHRVFAKQLRAMLVHTSTISVIVQPR